AHQSPELKHLLSSFISESEAAEVLASNNMSAVLLTKQINDLHALKSHGMSAEEYSKLLDILQACSQQQSAAERINRFPFPRQYASFSGVFVFIFTTLLPFSLVNDFEKNDPALVWLVVPISVLISWIFYTMEKVGDSSENPFENGLNDVPMTSICRDIEIDLKSMLREENIPDRLTPKQGILM
ncbi:MAG: hypothetical protein K2X81_01920, partial [Candidatus Obscuribacterales bacterium]|nr:hypothetical protein [Candidatus Obscuribacterales bacterium]